MRYEPIHPEMHDGAREQASDIQLLMQAATLLAGVAIAMASAGCNVADEADLHASQPSANANVARAEPQKTAASGNVQDLTY